MRKSKKVNMKYIIRRIGALLIIGLIIYGCFFFRMDKTSDKVNSSTNEQTNIKKEEEKPKETSLSLVMVGDALIHGALYDNMYVDGVYDFKPMLEVMKPIISKYDLAYYNQETILGGTELGLSTYPRFNSPYEVGDAFLDAGFNVVSMANNHTLDRGESAVNNSCAYWQDKEKTLNIYTAGSYCSLEDRDNVKIYEKNGIKYAMLSYTTVTNGINPPKGKEYFTNIYSDEKAKNDIEKYRDKVDLLMVAMHWGEEYTHKPINSQVRIANYLASLGVDIIIGAHPHVVEPIEKIGNTLVIYSLGNFVSAQQGINKLTGLMVSVNVTKSYETNETTVSDVEAELLYTLKDYSNKRGFRVYPYTALTDSILPEHEKYYNEYMNIVTGSSDWIKRGDYSGDSK